MRKNKRLSQSRRIW